MKRYFEVIANYPFSPYKVGDILETDITGCAKLTETPIVEGNEYAYGSLLWYPEIFAEVTDDQNG